MHLTNNSTTIVVDCAAHKLTWQGRGKEGLSKAQLAAVNSAVQELERSKGVQVRTDQLLRWRGLHVCSTLSGKQFAFRRPQQAASSRGGGSCCTRLGREPPRPSSAPSLAWTPSACSKTSASAGLARAESLMSSSLARTAGLGSLGYGGPLPFPSLCTDEGERFKSCDLQCRWRQRLTPTPIRYLDLRPDEAQACHCLGKARWGRLPARQA